MGKKIKKANFWVRRRAHLPLIAVGAVVILFLFFNEETSLSLNMKYENQIKELKSQIKLSNDSAAYYRQKRRNLLSGTEDLERIAREQYNMQRAQEDVYIVNDRK